MLMRLLFRIELKIVVAKYVFTSLNYIGRGFKVEKKLKNEYWVATIKPVSRHCLIIKEKVCHNKALTGQDNFKEKWAAT